MFAMLLNHGPLLPCLVRFLVFFSLFKCIVSSQIPTFNEELPMLFEFSNSSGGTLSCTARGDPQIAWVLSDGSSATNVPGLRHVMPDGSLVFPPFRAEDFRQDVHGVFYRCTATNSIGTVISSQIHVRGVVIHSFDVHVYDVYVIRGNSAIMRCHIPDILKNYITITAWIKDSIVFITASKNDANSKYFLLSTGELFIRDVQISDGMTAFRCQATHRLTGESKLSTTAGRLIVTEPKGSISPKIMFSQSEIFTHSDESAFLPCIAQGNPLPKYRWTKQTMDGYEIAVNLGQRLTVISGSLLIEKIESTDAGIYACNASNDAGNDKTFTEVKLQESLKATIHPENQFVDHGASAALHCTTFGSPIKNMYWMKNGRPLPQAGILQPNNFTLHIKKMSPIHSGIYQCFISNNFMSTYGVAVLQLADSLPEIIQSFEEQVLKPGEETTLECTAKGNPLPEITWTADNIPVGKSGRVRMETIRDQPDRVIGHLTLTNVRAEDGGLYKCIAKNNAGSDQRMNRVNVYGNINVRSHVRVIAVAEETVQIDCPFYGYPFESVTWEKDGSSLPVHLRQVPFRNGSLVLRNVQQKTDYGKYVCIVKSEDESSVRGNVEVVVMVPPKIAPFSFQDEQIREGIRARIQCVVSEGEAPIKLTWVKDGRPIPSELGVSIRDLDEFSSILMITSITPRHNGNYTCIASNGAGQAKHTAPLFVNVPPKVVPFTFQDERLLEGQLVRVSCVISRGDLPLSISWMKDGRSISSYLSINIRDFDEYSSVLSIEPVTSNHSGNYSCTARNHAGFSSFTASLVVKVPSKWSLEPQDVLTKAGERLVIDCQAEGFPKPVITWKKAAGNNFIEENMLPIRNNEYTEILWNGSLVFKHVQPTDEGFYYCVANNGIGEPLSKAISIKVQAPPRFDKTFENLLVKKGEDAQIVCQAEGDLPISYSWVVGNQDINSFTDHRYQIKNAEENEKSKESWSEFLISWVEKKDSLQFVCTAENSIGKDEMHINLIVQEVPDPPQLELPNNITDQTVLLKWSSPNDNNSPIIKFYIQYKKEHEKWNNKTATSVVDGEITEVNITDLQPATGYNFRVFAENAVGNGSCSSEATAMTDESTPSGAPQHVEVEATDANTLRISWKPPRKHTWNGVIRGYNIGYKLENSKNDYSFATLEVPEDYTDDLIYQLNHMNMYTQYNIVIQAYNAKGVGPFSKPVLAMTSEDVPTKPPESVRCSALSTKSIYVLWDPPPADSLNGILRGYKVLYKPAEEWYDALINSKIVQVSKITLQDLEVNANYSIQVLGFTKVGEGVKSLPVFCKTHEDVPEAPSVIKVLPSSSDSVVVSWKLPEKSNSAITKYNVYVSPLKDGKQDLEEQKTEEFFRDATVHSTQSDAKYLEITGLKKNRKYAFWVTAMSIIGESPKSPIMAETVADSEVAAKSASFDASIISPWKRDVLMSCKAVGVPQPQREWMFSNGFLIENERLSIRPDGALFIKQVSKEDSGNYTCSVFNEHGKDEVKYSMQVLVPPSAPWVEIVAKSWSTIKLRWKPGDDGGDRIRGYFLYYKRELDNWNKKEIRPEYGNFALEGLSCGATYQLYMESFNSIGQGTPCDTITVVMDGAVIEAPVKVDVIREGSTYITVNLDAWPSTACPVQHFGVEYKAASAKEWTVVGGKIPPSQKKLVISGLTPATWHVLKLLVETSGESMVIKYKFSTLTTTGATIAPELFEVMTPTYSFQLDPIVFIPAVAFVIVIVVASIVFYFYFKRKGGSIGTSSMISDVSSRLSTWIRRSRPPRPTNPPPRRHHHHRHSDRRSTLSSRQNSEPTPYATSHVSECYTEINPAPRQSGHHRSSSSPWKKRTPIKTATSAFYAPLNTAPSAPPPPSYTYQSNPLPPNPPEGLIPGIQETTFVFPSGPNYPAFATPIKVPFPSEGVQHQ